MSDLMKIARATTDQHFQWRVAAAMVLHAQTVYGSAAAGAKEKAFALATVNNPSAPDVAMLALVASDPAVVLKITLGGPGAEVPDTEEVPDADIKRVVAAMWSAVATKYTPGNGGGGQP